MSELSKPIWFSAVELQALLKWRDMPKALWQRLRTALKELNDDVVKLAELRARAHASGHFDKDLPREEEEHIRRKAKRKAKARCKMAKHVETLPESVRVELLKLLR